MTSPGTRAAGDDDPGARANARPGVRALSLRALLAVALLAALTRVVFEVQVRGGDGPVAAFARHLLGDESAYDRTARQLADGTLDRQRSFYQEPLYPFLLSLVYRVAPPPPLSALSTESPLAPVHLAIIGVQHALGVLTCVLVALLGARALGARAGLLAGLFAALSGPLIFTEGQLLKEGPALLAWTGILHLWMDVLEDRGSWRRAAALGLLLGAGILLRGNTWLLLACVLLTLLLLRIGGRRRPGRAALVLACVLLALLPATLFNLRRGELVLSTYQSGSNAAIGMPDNDDSRAGVVYEPLRAGRGDALYEESDAVALAEQAQGRRLSGPEVSRWWWGRVADIVARRPAVAAQRALLKLSATFRPDEVPDEKDWVFFRRAVPALSTPLSDLSVLGPLALLGLLLLGWRSRELLVVRASVLAVALTLVLFYVMGRYRLSAAPGLWILAAGAIVAGVARLRQPAAGARGRVRKVGIVLLAAGALAASQWRLRPEVDALGGSWFNLASIELADTRAAGDAAAAGAHREAAVAAAREAVRFAPIAPETHAILLDALDLETALVPARSEEADAQALRLLLAVEGRRTGRDAAPLLDRPRDEQLAAVVTLRALPGLPGRDEALAGLLTTAARRVAQSLTDAPHLPLALELVEEALARAPEDKATLVDKGLVLKRLGRLAEAETACRAALAAGIDTVRLNNNLAGVMMLLKRPADAVPLLEHALVLEPGNAVVQQNLERARAAAGRH